MFVDERQSLIEEELKQNGKVRVKELSEKFGVSQDLIRKDLTVLENAGKCEKIYGGATLIRENVNRKVANQRKNLNVEDKKIIAQKAYNEIKEGTIIFIDVSTTAIELASLIAQNHPKITVVTNMIDVLNILCHCDVPMIFIGGQFDYGHDGFVGSLANETLENYRFDMAFLGVVGVDLEEDSVMTYMADDAMTKKLVLSHTKKAYMLCEKEKLSRSGNYVYASCADFYGIISTEFSEEEKKLCKQYNLKDL